MSSWYVVQVAPGCHAQVAGKLQERHLLRVFYPVMRRWKSHARQRREWLVPLLGRYIFVEIPDGGFELVRQCDGVQAFLCNAMRPVTISERIVGGMMARQMQGEWDFVTPVVRYLKTDDRGELARDRRGNTQWIERNNGDLPARARVRIIEGEFADRLAIILSSGSMTKVKLLGDDREVKLLTTNLVPG